MTPTERRIGMHSKILEGDALRLIRELPDESVHLTLTSPPYHDHKEYGDGTAPEDLGGPMPYGDYLARMRRLCQELHRVTAPGCKALLQAANMKRAGTGQPSVTPLHWDLTRLLMEAGFVFYDEIVWLKKLSYTGSIEGRPLFGSYPHPGNPKMLNQLWENISVMHKPGVRPRRPEPDRQASRLGWEQWREWTHGVWRIESQSDPSHPATFNPERAERAVRLYSFRGEKALDPFAGTGTTVIAAEKLGRQGIGFELQRRYCITAASRGAALSQLELFPDAGE